MNPNEIKKGLECCTQPTTDCDNCPYTMNDDCFDIVKLDALAYINQLEAEVDVLKKEQNQFADLGKLYSEIRAEAIKEFAELTIKDICEQVNAPTPSESYIVEKCNQVIANRLKEMESE